MSPLLALRRLAMLVMVCLLPFASGHAQTPTVAAASDLQFALQEVQAQFVRDTGKQVQLVFGSSGNFYRQIVEGAPFELFLSADESFVTRLAKQGLTRDEGRLYAIGRLALFAPKGSPLQVDAELNGLRAALQQGAVRRFAIASPEHAPYGARAEEALRHAGLWDGLQDALVLGENVSQAAQFAASGNAQGGIIAYSLALAPNVAALGSAALLPESWHSPLRQRMVLLKNASPAAEAFYAYLQQPAAQAILSRYGFSAGVED
jgi:molybdate transport system substrate-binding protein